jgi:hypothetical protein
MLPEKKQTGAGWQPPLPLILAAWSETNDEAKQQRFHLHLRYADEHGALDKVSDYLQALEPRDWHLRAIP